MSNLRRSKPVGRVLRKLNHGEGGVESLDRFVGATEPRYVDVKEIRREKFLRNLDEFNQHGEVRVIMKDGKLTSSGS